MAQVPAADPLSPAPRNCCWGRTASALVDLAVVSGTVLMQKPPDRASLYRPRQCQPIRGWRCSVLYPDQSAGSGHPTPGEPLLQHLPEQHVDQLAQHATGYYSEPAGAVAESPVGWETR